MILIVVLCYRIYAKYTPVILNKRSSRLHNYTLYTVN